MPHTRGVPRCNLDVSRKIPSTTTLTAQTRIVARTYFQKPPLMSKPLMIFCVNQSISIETKNQASPNETSASGRVTSYRTGFSTVFRIPKINADQMTVDVEPWNVTEPRIQPTTPRTTALTAQETRSHLIMGESLLG
jgi:hypothetical protein